MYYYIKVVLYNKGGGTPPTAKVHGGGGGGGAFYATVLNAWQQKCHHVNIEIVTLWIVGVMDMF